MNTVRKIHNLLSTGQVTVSTGTPNNQRVLKQQQQQIQQHHNSSIVHGTGAASSVRCYICDTEEGAVSYVKFHDLVTNHSSVKFPNKIGQIIGSNFMVIVSVDDLICQRCVNLVNNYDRFETEAEKYKSNLLTSLNKKYDLALENFNLSTAGVDATPSPPVKMQKLTPTNASIRRITMNDSTGSLSGDEGSPVVTRKIAIPNDDENKQGTVLTHFCFRISSLAFRFHSIWIFLKIENILYSPFASRAKFTLWELIFFAFCYYIWIETLWILRVIE